MDAVFNIFNSITIFNICNICNIYNAIFLIFCLTSSPGKADVRLQGSSADVWVTAEMIADGSER